jgi:hypothetical protein
MSTGAPIEKGTPIRYPSTALLCVDSADSETYDRTTGFRIASTAPSQIFINNMQPIVNGYMTRLALTEVNIQWATPNVNALNNTLTLQYFNNSNVLQGTVRLLIDEGFYTGFGLAQAITSDLNNNQELEDFFGVETFACSYGGLNETNTNRANLTVTSTNPRFEISTTSTNGKFAIVPGGISYSTLGLPPVSEDLTNMMGLTPSIKVGQTLVPYSSVVGGFASMQYTPYIDIVSYLLTKNQNVRDGTTKRAQIGGGILARVYFGNQDWVNKTASVSYDSSGVPISDSVTDSTIGTSPCVANRQFSSPKQIQWNSTENVDIIDIQILDYKGNLVPIEPLTTRYDDVNLLVVSNTADIQMTFQVTEV